MNIEKYTQNAQSAIMESQNIAIANGHQTLEVEHLHMALLTQKDGLIPKLLKYNNVSLIHVAGADILSYKVIDYLDYLERKDIDLSCCNNIKMCCGEGVCGACTTRFSGHRVKRLCKVQSDPRNIFEGRRFI